MTSCASTAATSGSPARCSFKGRHAEQWTPRRFTWLFFHDEAVSFAAGHRPCGECRHRDYTAFRDAWSRGNGVAPPSAREMNRRLHSERLIRGTRRRQLHELDWSDLPDGAFVLHDGAPALVTGPHLVEWALNGYQGRRPRPAGGQATVITPAVDARRPAGRLPRSRSTSPPAS